MDDLGKTHIEFDSPPVDPEELQDNLKAAIDFFALSDGEEEEVAALQRVVRADTFEAAGILSPEKGLVLTMNDGSEFQVTIVCSRLPEVH
jgi:hypothetical protein